MDAGGGRRRESAVTEGHKLLTASVACVRIFKNFLGFEIEETLAHGGPAENSFEVPAAAAAAELFLRIQSDDRMAAFQIPSREGNRPKPMPLPSVHTRNNLFSVPLVAAMPAAIASASLKTRTGTPAVLPAKEEDSASCRPK